MSLEAGTKVGRYTITRLLAQGGMAEVYRAEQDLAGGISRKVAVKVIRPEYCESQDFREMFLDEARTACTLSHPNIAHIYEVGESDDGQLYMAMELVTGETLSVINRTLRDHAERFSDAALFAIGVATCGALEAVHALKTGGGTVNLVHRDVSPHNLLLSSSGALKLIDFGIAKAATNRNLTMPGVTKGKAGYFSPEQAMGKKLDGRSDLFSLGITLYKLASGETPFDDYKTHGDRHAALVRGQWKNLEDVYRGLPAGFYEVVARSLAVAPEHRYQSAREMRDALERAAFDARIRIGQSSLSGYVDDEGEITTGGARTSAAPPQPSPEDTLSEPDLTRDNQLENTVDERRPAATPYGGEGRVTTELPHGNQQAVQTDRFRNLAGGPASFLKRPVVLLAFLASVFIGVFGTLLVFGREPAPVVAQPGPPPPVLRAAPPPAAPELLPEPPHTAADADPPSPAARLPAKPPAVTVAVQVQHPVTRPTPPHPAPTHVEVKELEPPPQAIPPGEGKLRVSVAGPGRSSVIVGGDDWGEPPVNKRVNSGNFKVMVRLDDGTTSSTKAVVLPDQTTIVSFDVPSQKWTTRTQ
jgi:serine/threonine-protein kinase